MLKKQSSLIVLTSIIGLFFSSCAETEPRVLTIWAWNRNTAILENAIQRYKETVDPSFEAQVISFSQNDIDMKIQSAIQLGNGEDLADILLGDAMRIRGYHDRWPELFYDFSKSKITSKELSGFAPASIDLVKEEGKIFALPYGIAPTLVFAYRPLWKPEELDDISQNGWTWEDYKHYGKQIQERNKGKPIFMTAYNLRKDDRLYRTLSSQWGEWFMGSDLIVQVGNNLSLRHMSFVKELYEEKLLGHIDTGDYIPLMAEGQIAAQIQGFFLSGQLKNVAPQSSGKWILLPLPSWDVKSNKNSITGGSYLYVNAFSDQSRRGSDFVHWFSIDQNSSQDKLRTGGIFPAHTSVYSSVEFKKPDDFFGGQIFLHAVAQSVESAPAIYPSRFNTQNYNLFIEAQERILFHGADINTELANVASMISENAK